MSAESRKRIDRHERRIRRLEQALAEAKQNGEADRRSSLKVAMIGAAPTVFVAVLGFAALWVKPDEAVSCTEQRATAARLLDEHPGTWVPLRREDPVQQQCNINEYVQKLEQVEEPRDPRTESPTP